MATPAPLDLRFSDILSWLRDIEGWYSNDPEDAGGETVWGISAPIHQVAERRGIIPNNTDPKSLTWEQASTIYRQLFWDVNHCDQIPVPYCWWVFDTEVNQGTTGTLFLQASVRAEQDGVWGPNTARRCQTADPSKAMVRFQTLRLERYRKHRLADQDFRGWANRCGSLMALSYDARGRWKGLL